MGFFANIVRDSQKPPPGAKRVPHSADPHSGGAAKAVLPAESRPLGFEAAAPQVAHRSYEPFRPAVKEQTDRRTEDGPAASSPMKPTVRQEEDPSSVEPTRATRLVQNNDGGITLPKPVIRRETDRPNRRPATAQTSTDRASASNEAVSSGTEPTNHEDAVLVAPTAKRPKQSVREPSGKTRASMPVEKIAWDETAAPPSQSPQNLGSPAASPRPVLSAATVDVDNSVNAKPAPDRKQGDIASPAKAIPHPGKSPEIPPPGRQTTAPGAADLLPSTAAIPVSVEQAPPDTRPEGGDDTGPPPEFRVAAARPADPIRIETPAALAPVPNREEGRPEWTPSRPVPTPEGPKVQIGLLEVVVQAPASAPKGTHLANKARNNIASRHYLRNM